MASESIKATREHGPGAVADAHTVWIAPGVQALASRAAWIPGSKTLVLADLHLGKPECFAAAGAPLPGAIARPMLAELARMVASLGAARVMVVGDMLHARIGLTTLLIDEVAAWRRESLRGVEVLLVPGNHDRSHVKVAGVWDLTICEASHHEDSVTFVHDPSDVDRSRVPPGALVLSGHVHPVIRVGGLRGSLRAPCFVVDSCQGGGTLCVLPAFTDFSSGVSMTPARGRRLIAAVDGALIEFAAATKTLSS